MFYMTVVTTFICFGDVCSVSQIRLLADYVNICETINKSAMFPSWCISEYFVTNGVSMLLQTHLEHCFPYVILMTV